jgi:hypothetical protein
LISRVDQHDGDEAVLQRLCKAYAKAAQQPVPAEYKPTSWWESVQRTSLSPVMRALAESDLPALQAMYRNFFRDSCSDGLVGKTIFLQNPLFQAYLKGVHERHFLSDALHRLDYWSEITEGKFSLQDLKGPRTGNPFGIKLEDILVRTGSEYQHYCAHRIGRLLSGNDMVVEIGGGYGGMAYYLLRDYPQLTYIGFDLPETIALASYYLLKAFPEKRFLLCGEESLTEENLGSYDVVLLPVSELPAMPSGFANLTFSSHAISDLSSIALIEYIRRVANITRGYFLYEGLYKSSHNIRGLVMDLCPSFHLVGEKLLRWYSQKSSDDLQDELLYQVRS